MAFPQLQFLTSTVAKRLAACSLQPIAYSLLLSACMVGPNYREPSSKVEKNWVEHKAVNNKAYGEAEVFWWRSFNDPTLTKLIEIAFENNPSLQATGVKVLQERALLNRSIGELFPQQQGVSAGYSYNYIPRLNGVNSSSVNPLLGGGANGGNFSSYFTSNQYFFSSSWEIDFWGKYRRIIESDKANYLAAITAYDDSLVTLIGDVAQNYVNIRTYEEEIRITRENIKLQQESLRIATVRFHGGQVSQLDVTQAQTELCETEAQVPQLENRVRQSKNALALLLGLPPNGIDPLLHPGKIPAVPDSIVAGIPHDLLRRRPDVREAGLKAAAKSALIGVEVTNLLPAFSLSGSFGATSSNAGTQQLANIFNWQNSIVNAANGFTMPLFNYGRLVNQVRVADANFQSAILNYQNTVLSAQKDVENGLSAYRHGRDGMLFLAEAVKSAKQSTKLAMVRYIQGQADYTTVLTAEQKQLDVESSYVSSQGSTVLGVVSTYRALGGGWQLRNGRDVIPEEVKQQMAKRTNWGRMLSTNNHLPRISPEDRPAKWVPKVWSLKNLFNTNK
ncbi:MAG: efflux transporter outer membrane subunit [Chthoniobacterales bacterium]|nr:efflux transporter outer membrane subunit [Chthoniobacterales bacterium]